MIIKIKWASLICIILLACSSSEDNNLKLRHKIENSMTKEAILNELDNLSNPYEFFPDLEHGYFCTSGNRINVYADETNWAIVFEKTGYNNRSFACEIEVLYFGNCLKNLDTIGKNKWLSNAKIFNLISENDLNTITDEFETLNKKAEFITIRGQEIKIDHDPNTYLKNDISLEMKNEIDLPSFIRLLDEQNPELMRASDSELRTCIPVELPLILKIDNWHYKPYNNYSGELLGAKPSSYETFHFIADVIINRDSSLYKPNLAPNNNWRNWPKAGSL